MPHPLTVQLCDKRRNHSDEASVKVVLNHDRGLKVCKCTNRSFSCPLQSHLQSEFMCEMRDGSHIFTVAEKGLPTSDFRLRTSDFRLQTSDFRLRTSDFGLPTSDFRLRTSDFRLQTSDFRLPTSDFRLQTSDFRLPTSYFRLSYN